ncbi:hypothetical protein V5799_011251, partial [Amblyomma americanum]
MERIDHALKDGGRLKAVKRKLGIGKNQMYALRDKERNVVSNMDKLVKLAAEFYTNLYRAMQRGKEAGEDQ